jgi:hypothetical protein
VLEITRQKAKIGRLPPLHNYLVERQSVEPARPGPAVQLIARDAFVSDTAIKLDQMLIEMKSLGRELQLVKSDIAELRDDSARGYRFSEFLEREHKLRAAKLDELCRRFDYLKTRVDAVDGNSKGDFHAYQTFDAVSRRLTELGSLEREFHQTSWNLKLSTGLFAASLVMWVLVVLIL